MDIHIRFAKKQDLTQTFTDAVSMAYGKGASDDVKPSRSRVFLLRKKTEKTNVVKLQITMDDCTAELVNKLTDPETCAQLARSPSARFYDALKIAIQHNSRTWLQRQMFLNSRSHCR